MNAKRIYAYAAAAGALAVAAPAAYSQFGASIRPYSPPPVVMPGAWAPGWAPPSVVTGGAWYPADTYVNWLTPEEAAALANVAQAPVARSSDRIEARFQEDNRLLVRWFGDARTVNRITFGLLDSQQNVLMRQVVERLPAEARLRLTNKTAYYQVLVEYADGTTSSVVSPI